MLRPERDVELNPAPFYSDLYPSSHHVFLPDPIENDVDCADENLPDAVETEEVP